MSDIRLEKLTRSYGASNAVDHVDLHIQEGEFYSLLGPSGCGKSTTLRMIAGFVEPSGGKIIVGGRDVTPLPPEKRDIGIVFQNYAIFPHMSVADNIAFGLKLRKVPKDEITREVNHALEKVGLAGFGDRFQRNLSGGQQQRVAIARVLVTKPRILLLDEPLSALDKSLREEMKFWIKNLQQELGITTVYVTHDQDEALTMSDRIGVMRGGRIEQSGTPREIYEHPASLFVTSFIGQSNMLKAEYLGADGEGAALRLAGQTLRAGLRHHLSIGDEAVLVVRPESILMGPEAVAAGVPLLEAEVTGVVYQGAMLRYRLMLVGQPLTVERQNQTQLTHWQAGDKVQIGWAPERAQALPTT